MNFTLTFSGPQNVTVPGQDGVQYAYPFTIINTDLIGAPEEHAETREHRFIIGISRTRLAGWHISDADLPKILFEFGKRYVVSLIEEHRFPSKETIRCPMITTELHPEQKCPFHPNAIPQPAGLSIEVEQPKPPMGFNFRPEK